MTPKERAVAALNLKQPDKVPTFELEFQLEEEMFGKKFLTDDLKPEAFNKMSSLEREARIYKLAEDMTEVYTALDYSIIPVHGIDGCDGAEALLVKYLREMIGDTRMICHHGDNTFSIPDGNMMYEFSYRLADDFDGVLAEAQRMADYQKERNKQLAETGFDTVILCSDYCYNTGPFVSPDMFSRIIQPYLYQIIKSAREEGLYTIKHTDGNIMPILDMLVDCNPHALHSIDPMAGVDIKEVKRLVGDKVCLCGNVHCAAMQTGTEQDVIDSAEYCMTHGKPGGGYIYCTSNVPFKGLPPERYQLVLDIWKRMRDY